MMDDEFANLMPNIKDFSHDLNLLTDPDQQPQQVVMNTSADFNQLDEILGGRPLLTNPNVYNHGTTGTNNANVNANTNTNANMNANTNQFVFGQGEINMDRPFFPLFNSVPQHQQQQQIPQQLQQQTLPPTSNDYTPSPAPSSSTPASASAAPTNTNNRRKRKYPDEGSETTSNSTTVTATKPTTEDDVKVPVSLSPDGVIIDQNMLIQLGGLAYAELCKERAREAFKEAKKNEHLAKGNFDRMKRRKKGDTSMTPREKYVRRLRMNQDSAAAARHAQEVYVSVLERLVRTSEAEKKSFIAEVHQVRVNEDHYKSKCDALSKRVKLLEKENSFLKGNSNDQQDQVSDEKLSGKKYDPAIAKYLDLFKDVATVGANPDIGVQPARAV